MGGAHPTADSQIVVNGIGTEKASNVWFSANTDYLTLNMNMAEAALAFAEAAFDIYGQTNGYPEVCSIMASWYSVGVLSFNQYFGAPNDSWKLTFIGWVYFDSGNSWIYTTEEGWMNCLSTDPTNGSIILWLSGCQKSVFTSANDYPWFYDYSSNSWKLLGSFCD